MNLKEPKSVEKGSKPSGELALFLSIWATRPRVCAVCGEPLKDFSVSYFSHILPKSAFPKFRLYAKNIVLKCNEHHHEYGTMAKSDLLPKSDRWIPIFDLHEELIKEYYGKNS